MKTDQNSIEKLEDCPIKLNWGTFCEHLWERGSARTIVDARPAISGQIMISKNAPDYVPVNLGAHDILAVFGRANGIKGAIDEELLIKSNIPNSQEITATIKMEPSHKIFFHSLRLDMLPLSIPKHQRRHEETIWFSFHWKGHELGKVSVEIDIDIRNKDHGTKSKK